MVTTTTPTSELVFGRYQIIRRLAVGGMGEVFLARQSAVAGFDRLVILKSLLPDLAQQPEFVEQFLDEAKVAATLNHPNIVSIYEVGSWNGTYFIAMEYIRGDNLSRLQRAAGRMKTGVPVDVAAFIVHDAAHALDHAHKAEDIHGKPQNIVHRDISPQNIMVRTDGVTKVVDFGIAKAANRTSRTATGLLKGKVQYMSPEQVQGAELDGRADQFALGVVLWELLARQKLFTGQSEIDILRSVINRPIPLLSTQTAGVPPRLERCVARMLARDREQRYPSLAECAADLKGFLESGGMKNAQARTATFVKETLGEEIEAKTVDLTPTGANNFVINLAQQHPPPTGPTGAARREVPASRARLGIAAGAGLALLLAVVAAAVILWPQPPAPEAAAAAAPAPVRTVSPKVAIDTQPTGAVVRIDGKEVGKTPVTVDVAPGVEHEVEAEAEGYETRSEKVTLSAGQMKPLLWALTEKRATLSVTTSIAGAELLVDGKHAGKAPLQLKDLAPGAHTLRATAVRGRATYLAELSVTLARGQDAARALKLEKVEHRRAPTPTPTTAAGADTPKPASFTLDTKPWAKLYVDGKYVDSTPVSKLQLVPGAHKIHLVQEGAGVDETRTVRLKPGESFRQSWKLKTR